MTSRTFGFWYSRMITSCNRCRTPLRSPLPWPQVRCGWKWIMAWKGFTTARIMLSLHKYCAHCRSLMISYDIFFSFIVNLFFQCLHTYFSAPRLMFLLYGYLILYWQYVYIYICMYISQLSLLLKGTVVAPPDKFGKSFLWCFTYNLCLFTK